MTKIDREKSGEQALVELLDQFAVLVDEPGVSLGDLEELKKLVEERINELRAERGLGRRENSLETL